MTLSIVAIVISFLGVVFSYFAFIARLQERIRRLETIVEPFWKLVEENLPRLLVSPHTPRFDELLIKLSEGKLKELCDICELEKLLLQDIREANKEQKDRVLLSLLVLARLQQIKTDMILEKRKK